MELIMENKYLVFSCGVCDCNKDVNPDYVSKNLIKIIETAASYDKQLNIKPILIFNCSDTEGGEKYKNYVSDMIKKFIKENKDLSKRVHLKEYVYHGHLGTEKNDIYCREKSVREINELHEKDDKAKFIYMYKVDQDDIIDVSTIESLIDTLNSEESKNISVVYPIKFLFKDRKNNEYTLEEIDKDRDVIVIKNKEKVKYEITRLDDAFLCEPVNTSIDANFCKLLFSKKFLSAVVDNPINHNYGQFRADIIKDAKVFKEKQKILSLNFEELNKYVLRCYEKNGILENDKILDVFTDWIFKIPSFEQEALKTKEDADISNFMLMTVGSTISNENTFPKEKVVMRRVLSAIHLYIYSYFMSKDNLDAFNTKMNELINDVLPGKAERNGEYKVDKLYNMFFKYINNSIEVLKEQESIPFFIFSNDNDKNITTEEKNNLIEKMTKDFKRYEEYVTISSASLPFDDVIETKKTQKIIKK